MYLKPGSLSVDGDHNHFQSKLITMNKILLSLFSFVTATVISGLSAEAWADRPHAKQLGLQDPVTPVMETVVRFHDGILLPLITAIVLLVMGLILYIVLRFNSRVHPVPSTRSHNVPLEIVWTLIPITILILIAIPSFRLLFLTGVPPETEMTVKVTGNQWNWTYEYPDHGDFSFTSYMIKDEDLNPSKGQVRLLSTDEPVVLPVNTKILFQITSSDVIHSFAVPAFGVKMDAVPGRLTGAWTEITKPGIYYGQCSELCGKDHGFMPIEIHAVSKDEFAKWVVAKGGTMKGDTEKAPETAPAAVEPKDKKAN
jgi:cytochrome c oxidase subunit 2